jgi:thiaminase/transcriptional activator TenA
MTMSVPHSLPDENRKVRDEMQRPRCLHHVRADRLPDGVLALRFEFAHAFVETAILVFGDAMLRAPGSSRRRRLVGVLHALAEGHMGLFVRCLTAAGVTPAVPDATLPTGVTAFASGVLELAANGAYHNVIAIVLATEWMYATWSEPGNTTIISNAELRRWVALDEEPDFLDQAAWLRAEIDAAQPGERDRLSVPFRRTLQLEIAFHGAPYDAGWREGDAL